MRLQAKRPLVAPRPPATVAYRAADGSQTSSASRELYRVRYASNSILPIGGGIPRRALAPLFAEPTSPIFFLLALEAQREFLHRRNHAKRQSANVATASPRAEIRIDG